MKPSCTPIIVESNQEREGDEDREGDNAKERGKGSRLDEGHLDHIHESWKNAHGRGGGDVLVV
jgi:hypothetical protein